MLSKIERIHRSSGARSMYRSIRYMSSKNHPTKPNMKYKPATAPKTESVNSTAPKTTPSSTSAKVPPSMAQPGLDVSASSNQPSKSSIWGKLLLGAVVGLPVGLVAGLKLSPDFFYRCEASYPQAIAFLRRYLPLNWPQLSPSDEIEEVEDDGPITVVLKEDELEQSIRDLLHAIDETDKVDGVELDRIVSVLIAAREMLLEEKRRIEADVCLLSEMPKEENALKEEFVANEQPTVEDSVEDSVNSVEEMDQSEEQTEWHLQSSEETKEGEWGFVSLNTKETTETKEMEDELKEVPEEISWKEYEERVVKRIELVIREIREIEAKEKEVMERVVEVEEEKPCVEQSEAKCECESEQPSVVVEQQPEPEQQSESEQPSVEPEQSPMNQPIPDTESSPSSEFTDWDHAQSVLEQARSTLLTPSILSQVESAVREQVTSLTSQLHSSLQTAIDSDIQQSIDEFERQLREASVEESRRLYTLLKEQRTEMEEQFKSKLMTIEDELREILIDKLHPEEQTQIASILNQYNSRVSAIQREFIEQLDDLVYAEEMWEKAKRLQEEEIMNETEQEEMKKRVTDIRNMIEEEQEDKNRILIEMQKRVNDLIRRIDKSIRIFESNLIHQECQRAFIHLQNKCIQGGDITGEIGMLASKAEGDPILNYLIQKIPKSIRISGIPSSVTYLVEFESLRKDARAASKTAEDASFGGQLLGRTVASIVGTQGVDPEDPLAQIEKVNECLMKGDMKQAYEIGSQIQGGAREVLQDWLQEVEDRLEFDRVMRQIQLHLEREATYFDTKSHV